MSIEALKEFKTADLVRKNEPEWLYDKRLKAWKQAERSALPDRVEHLWRYTDPNQFLAFDNVQNGSNNSCLKGHDSNMLTDEALEKGVVLLPLARAAREYPDLVREKLGRAVGGDFGKFEALNLSQWKDGCFLFIPAHVELKEPVKITRTIQKSMEYVRLLVVVGENASATVVDEYSGGDEKAMMNSVVELFVEEYARVRFHTTVGALGGQRLLLTQRNHLANDARLASSAQVNGGATVKTNWGTELRGRGAQSEWVGVLYGTGEEHVDMHTRHHHFADDTWSNLDYKVALNDSATSVYTGRINIEENARNCEAYQENRNLVLSERATVESIPELEIINDEVKCSHGVTVGPLDKDQLFYFNSRGVSKVEAKKLILSGFYEANILRMPEAIQDVNREKIVQKIGENA